MALKLMYITNDPAIALIAEKNGVDRVWVDLETLGKEERQKGINSVKSHHTVADIARIRPLLTMSEMLVRVDPWHEHSRAQIDAVVSAGADMIMLPMWKTPEDVARFLDAVNGRCKTTLLLETAEAEKCADAVLTQGGFDEIHIGLNDLHLAKHMTFMFELLSDGTVETLCRKFKAAGIPYGFGGIARLGQGELPAERVITEHYRLGSTRAILSRSFCDTTKLRSVDEANEIFTENMKTLRKFESTLPRMSPAELEENRIAVCAGVNAVVRRIGRERIAAPRL